MFEQIKKLLEAKGYKTDLHVYTKAEDGNCEIVNGKYCFVLYHEESELGKEFILSKEKIKQLKTYTPPWLILLLRKNKLDGFIFSEKEIFSLVPKLAFKGNSYKIRINETFLVEHANKYFKNADALIDHFKRHHRSYTISNTLPEVFKMAIHSDTFATFLTKLTNEWTKFSPEKEEVKDFLEKIDMSSINIKK